jgi:proton-translocating NADH-quinone oxidoreductase chain M
LSSFFSNFISSYFYIDSISYVFVWLVFLIIPVCAFFGRTFSNVLKYNLYLLLLTFFLILTFISNNLFLFYISFEIVTILMYFILIQWGYEERRVLASYYFFYFTFAGSLLFLLGILLVYNITGTAFFTLIKYHIFSIQDQCLLWWLFFFAFAIKVPMFPFHIWLPEAHVEAPTGGSILLAGVLLKIGFYGFYRISIPFFFYASQYYLFFLYFICFVSITHSMLVSLRQIDAKRIIAYSSIAHMNFGLLGLFSFTVDGLLGSLLLMLGHGFISSGLFAMIGILYSRYGTRILYYYGGLVNFMPKLSFFFFLFILGNISFPLTFSFPAEVLIFFSLITKSKILFLFIIPGLVLNLVNSILLYSRIFFGYPKLQYISAYFDITILEFLVLSYLLFFMIFFGINPSFILNFLYYDVLSYVSSIVFFYGQ